MKKLTFLLLILLAVSSARTSAVAAQSGAGWGDAATEGDDREITVYVTEHLDQVSARLLPCRGLRQHAYQSLPTCRR